MMPASAMKPIIEVAVNGAPNNQWPSMMPIRVSGIGVRMTSGNAEAAELRHHQNIDAEDCHGESSAHVTEGDVGNFPLSVPQQRGLRLDPAAGRTASMAGFGTAPQSCASIRRATSSMP